MQKCGFAISKLARHIIALWDAIMCLTADTFCDNGKYLLGIGV